MEPNFQEELQMFGDSGDESSEYDLSDSGSNIEEDYDSDEDAVSEDEGDVKGARQDSVIKTEILGKKISELEVDFNLELKKMIQFEKNRQLRQFSSIYYKKIKNNSEIYEN